MSEEERAATIVVTDTKLHVTEVTLSAKDNVNLL